MPISESKMRELVARLAGDSPSKIDGSLLILCGKITKADIELFIQENGIPPLVALLASEGEAMLVNTTRALAHISTVTASRDLIVSANAVQPCCSLLSHGNGKVRKFAALICRNLSNNANFQSNMLESKSLPPLLARLDDPQLAVRRQAAAAMARLLKNPQLHQPVIKLDVMKSLTAFLTETDEDICKSVVAISRSLAAGLVDVNGVGSKFGIIFANVIVSKVRANELPGSDAIELLILGLFKAFDPDVCACVKDLVITLVDESEVTEVSIAKRLVAILEKKVPIDVAEMTIDFMIALVGLSSDMRRQFLKTKIVKICVDYLDNEKASKEILLRAIYCLAQENKETRSQLVACSFKLKHLLTEDQELTRESLALLVYMAGAEYYYPEKICSDINLPRLLSMLKDPAPDNKQLVLELLELLVKSDLQHNLRPTIEERKLDQARERQRQGLISGGGLRLVFEYVFDEDSSIAVSAVNVVRTLGKVKDSKLQSFLQQKIDVDRWLPLLALKNKGAVDNVAHLLKPLIVSSRERVTQFLSCFSSTNSLVKRGVSIASVVIFDRLDESSKNKVVQLLLSAIQGSEESVCRESARCLARIAGTEDSLLNHVLAELGDFFRSPEATEFPQGLLSFLQALMEYCPKSKEKICQPYLVSSLVSLFQSDGYNDQLLDLFFELTRYYPEGCRVVRAQGALGYLAKFIASEDPMLREKAMRIIENICSDSREVRDRIFQGALNILVFYRHSESEAVSNSKLSSTSRLSAFVEAMSVGTSVSITEPSQVRGVGQLAEYLSQLVKSESKAGLNQFLLRMAELLSKISSGFKRVPIDSAYLAGFECLLLHVEGACAAEDSVDQGQYEYFILSLIRNLSGCQVQNSAGVKESLLHGLNCMPVVARKEQQPAIRFFWELFASSKNAFVKGTCLAVLKNLVERNDAGKQFFLRHGFKATEGGYANEKNQNSRLGDLINNLCEVTESRDLFEAMLSFMGELSVGNAEVQAYLVSEIIACITVSLMFLASYRAMADLLDRLVRYDASVISIFCKKKGIPGLVSLLNSNDPQIQRRALVLIRGRMLHESSWVEELQRSQAVPAIKNALANLDQVDKSAANDVLKGLGYGDVDAELHEVDSSGQVVVKHTPFHVKRSDLTLEAVELGRGAYGKVLAGIWKGSRVAVKFFMEMDRSPKFMHRFIKEVAIMQMLRHDNVVEFYGAGDDDEGSFLVMKLMPEGSLHKLIHEKPDLLEPKRRIFIARGIASALDYLHSMSPSVFHRDIKSENVLVGDGYQPKLTDFGLSLVEEEMTNSVAVESNMLATPHWCAPERYQGSPYDHKCDIYSFGIVLWEMVALALPWAHFSGRPDVVSNLIREAVLYRRERPEIPKSTPPAYAKWIRSCWAQLPGDRPSARVVADGLHAMSPGSL